MDTTTDEQFNPFSQYVTSRKSNEKIYERGRMDEEDKKGIDQYTPW